MSDLREKLITALTASDRTSDYTSRVDITREQAEEIADHLIADGVGEGTLQMMTADDVNSDRLRSFALEEHKLRSTAEQRAADEVRRLSGPRETDPALIYAMRGGQPGSWFDNEPAYDGCATYEQSGALREDMERKVRSAFAKY